MDKRRRTGKHKRFSRARGRWGRGSNRRCGSLTRRSGNINFALRTQPPSVLGVIAVTNPKTATNRWNGEGVRRISELDRVMRSPSFRFKSFNVLDEIRALTVVNGIEDATRVHGRPDQITDRMVATRVRLDGTQFVALRTEDAVNPW